MSDHAHSCPVTRITGGSKAHFFGYYDKSPWDASGRRILALEAEPVSRMPRPGEKATIGLISSDSGKFVPVAETAAWNWQQGCMLQWLPQAPDRLILYNDVSEGKHVSIIHDLESGRNRILPLPVYSVSHDGRFALSTSFARLAHTRPVVGYVGVDDPFEDQLFPEKDGVWWMDLQTGEHRLILSVSEVRLFHSDSTMEGVKHRFEHVMLNPGGTRFFLLHRWPRWSIDGNDAVTGTAVPVYGGKPRQFYDRLITADAAGGRLHVLNHDLVSHFDWRDDSHLLAWARLADDGEGFFLFKDQTAETERIGKGVLTVDGHCSYSPDRRWILTDTYPSADTHERELILFEVASGQRVDVARFATPPPFHRGDIRCDLHPRWSRNGRQVCVDGIHEGKRQMFLIDVSAVIDGAA